MGKNICIGLLSFSVKLESDCEKNWHLTNKGGSDHTWIKTVSAAIKLYQVVLNRQIEYRIYIYPLCMRRSRLKINWQCIKPDQIMEFSQSNSRKVELHETCSEQDVVNFVSTFQMATFVMALSILDSVILWARSHSIGMKVELIVWQEVEICLFWGKQQWSKNFGTHLETRK